MTRCSVCKRETDSTPRNRYRPFCSERCQLIDLGMWAGESYRVAGGKVDDHEHPADEKSARDRGAKKGQNES
jgi:endogenous inhibitor of DNA gyrase (YacG/DUF329 family)